MIKHVYIHFPFCLKKCAYCSFYSVVHNHDLVDKYISRLLKEIDLYMKICEIRPETIYFGGGTPSLLKPENVSFVLQKFDLEYIKEITLEVNPATDISYVKDTGINRISIGTQSMIDRELNLLGRIHSIQDIISLTKSGIRDYCDNISYDLIYGLPNQSISDVVYSLNELLRLKPNHVSIYCLSLEEDVSLYKQIAYLPSDEVVSDMYFTIRETLLQNSYTQYELSSFCLNGKVSHHNLAYWSGEQYLGLGAGACGYIENYRYQNNDLDDYLKDDFIKEKTYLEKEEIEKEYIITGLRKVEGISLNVFQNKFGYSFQEKYKQILNKMLDKGFIEVDSNVKLKPEYYFLSNEVLCEFL